MARNPKTEIVKTEPKSTALTTYEDQLAALARQSVEQEASVAVGQSFSIRGGQLSFNGSPIQGNTLNVIVVDSILENSYFPGKFDPDTPASPTCYAFGRDDAEMAPHEKAEDPQHEKCAGCHHNAFGTADNGKGKACKNIRRLIVLPGDNLASDVLAKAPFAFLKVPVTSVKAWAAYVRTLSAVRRRPPVGVVTNVKVVPDPKTQFKVVFDHVADLTKDSGMAVLARVESAREAIVVPYPPTPEPFQQPAPGKKAAAKARRY
jgi:hypothetical protein